MVNSKTEANELHWFSAVKAAAHIRQGLISPTEYLEATLKRINLLQPSLNCFTTVMADSARQDALEAERKLSSGEPVGPLNGVSLVIEDVLKTAGTRTAFGSAIFSDRVPTVDDIVVSRLRKAGAIIVGKTTMSELGHKGFCDSPVYGATPNPWDPAYAIGGASGGSASAVAAGLSPLGLGLDGFGGVRVPAAMSGLIGMKPTLCLVPYVPGGSSFSRKICPGFQCRTVADVAVMLDAVAGPDPADPLSLMGERVRLNISVPGKRLDGLRIGYFPRLCNEQANPEVLDHTTKVARLFERWGAQVDEHTQDFDWIEGAEQILLAGDQASLYGKYERKWSAQMDPELLDTIAQGQRHTLIEYRQAQIERSRLFDRVQDLFLKYDFLLMPTLPTTGLPVSFRKGDKISLGDTETTSVTEGWSAYTYPFSLTGHPALSVPSGFASNGLPVGIQVVGPWWSDLDILRLGDIVEAENYLGGRHPVQ